ncbi:LPXTG cell wall anchor domain-containing protein [Oceanobacillus sp. FSL K6-2867]|uniref:LPXTG cell wall anchor domain-containing protein n=1 Tax=Oceanobacillus sp. FSL K6-2867 TaxID=2954748 RepID=UPI0030DBDE94
MLKRLSLLGLSLMLVLYPTAVLAADNTEQQDSDQIDMTETQTDIADLQSDNEEDNAVTEANESNKEEPAESADLEELAEEAVTEDEQDAEQIAPEESIVESEQDIKETPSDAAVEETSEAEASEEQADSNAADADVETDAGEDEATVETEEEDPADEAEDLEQSDEDLDLTKIHGAANGEITYDFNKGYYVLDLQAGLSNYSSSQVLDQKWVAFALPDGVYLPDVKEVPSGVAQVYLPYGKSGIAIRIPDVSEFPDSKYVYPKIPLMGEPNDNNPNENLYLLNVNVDEMTFENLGQIKSQRNVDFSVMQGEPELDIDGSIEGKAVYDTEKRNYTVDLTIKATNNSESDITDIYAGFKLPEGVGLIESEDISEDIEVLQLEDGSQEVAVKLPNMESGEDGELHYQIPVLGKSSEVIEASTTNVYRFHSDGTYHPLGQFEGSVRIDFSEMSETWDFSAESQLVRDFPGLEANQFGLRFGFTALNLTFDNIDEVKIEFNVPDGITIHEPDSYSQGSIPDSLQDFLNSEGGFSSDLDLNWDGNTATINLDTVNGISGYEGFFTAFGESSQSLESLEGLEVIVTLYQDGVEVVREIDVPFEIVSYEGDDGENPEEPGDDNENPGDDNQNDGDDQTGGDNDQNDGDDQTGGDNDQNDGDDQTGGDNDQNDGDDQTGGDNDQNDGDDQTGGDNDQNDDDDQTGGDSDQNDGDDSTGGNNDQNNGNNPSAGNNEDDQQTAGQNVNNDNNSQDNTKGSVLPDTATNMYSMLLIGMIFTVAGLALMLFRKKKIAE